jgi:hypothetical protein
VLKSAFRDDAEAKGYADGSIFQNVRTEQQPGLVYSHAGPDGKPARVPQDQIRNDLLPRRPWSARRSRSSRTTRENKGVSAGLNNIQKVGEGERLAGRANAEDEFTADLSKAPVDISDLVGPQS